MIELILFMEWKQREQRNVMRKGYRKHERVIETRDMSKGCFENKYSRR